MLIEQLRKEWRVREAAGAFDDAPRFGPEGLILGAGTVLAKVGDDLDVAAERLEALLAVAYGRSTARSATGHVKAAVARWRAGDVSKAKLHLALARLEPRREPRGAAHRLFIADSLMRAGFTPATILAALEVQSAATLKYRADQPRVPAGSGRPSGQWTASGDVASTDGAGSSALEANDPTSPSLAPPRAMSAADAAVDAGAMAGAAPAGLGVIGGTADEAVGALGFVSRIATGAAAADLTGPFVALGVLFWPSHGPEAKWVDVGGPPADIQYYWSPDESTMRIAYRDSIGDTRVTIGTLDRNGDFRDPKGDLIGRLIKGVGVAVSLQALEDIARDDGPDLCPASVPDRNGARAADRDYEDFVKRMINPDNPTPRAMGYGLPNPTTKTGTTIFDDCEHATGMMVEAKGNYAELIGKFEARDTFWLEGQWVEQAEKQLDAARGRKVTWFFKDRAGERFARKIFDDTEVIGKHIQTVYLPD